MLSSGMLRCVTLVRTDVSEELSSSLITDSCHPDNGGAKFLVPPKRPFLQEPHGVTSRMTAFFLQCKVQKCTN
jgi:hypothetical protein